MMTERLVTYPAIIRETGRTIQIQIPDIAAGVWLSATTVPAAVALARERIGQVLARRQALPIPTPVAELVLAENDVEQMIVVALPATH